MDEPDVRPDQNPVLIPEVVNDGYDLVRVGDLAEHPDNPRRGDLDSISESIIANGFYGAVVVQTSTKRILAGNHRWKAARATGLESIPVIWADVDDTTARRILLADNRTNDLAGYDDAALIALLEEIRAEGSEALVGTGYDEAALESMLDDLGRDGDVGGGGGMQNGEDLPDHIDKVVAEIVKPGQVWECAGQRVICGDSTKRGTFDALMGSHRADLVFTSPPYNVGVAYEEHDDRVGDWKPYGEFLSSVLGAMAPYIAQGRALCWNIAPSKQTFFARQFTMLEAAGLEYRRTMIWHKNSVPAPQWWASEENPVARNFRVNPVFEFVFVFSRGKLEHGGPVDLNEVLRDDVFYVNAMSSTLGMPSGEGATGSTKNSTLKTRSRPKAHPATYPADLVGPFVDNLTAEDETVLDPFCGAGTTLLAAHRHGRRGFGAELTPRYVDLTLWRLQKETGQAPRLISGGKRGSYDFIIETPEPDEDADAS